MTARGSRLRFACLALAGCGSPPAHIDHRAPTPVVAHEDLVGTGGPTLVIATARDGSWVLLCQAREDTDHDGRISITSDGHGTYGDQAKAYLVLGSGDGEPLDDVVAIDPSGRRAVVVRDQRLVMIQPGLGPDLDLTTLGAVRVGAHAEHEDVAFDPSGRHLVYARASVIMIRDLASGQERAVDPGPGRLDSFSIDPSGHTIVARVFAMQPGDQPWSTNREPRHPTCWTGAPGDSITESGTPAIDRRIRFDGVHDIPRDIPGFIGVLADGVVWRAASGALMIERGAPASELVPAACAGRVLGITGGATSLIVACKSGELIEAGRGTPRKVGATIRPPTEDSTLPLGHVLIATSAANHALVRIDLRTGATTDGTELRLVAEHGPRSLLTRGDKLVVNDDHGERIIATVRRGRYGGFAQLLEAGAFVYIEPDDYARPLLVDMTTGTVVGTTPRSPVESPLVGHVRGLVVGLADDGRLLVSFPPGVWSTGFLPGPFAWVKAVPLGPYD